MSSSAKATINLQFESEKQVDTLLSALIPEAKLSPTRRSKIVLNKNGQTLSLVVAAEDTVALRATLNAYLRWINSTMNVVEVVRKA